MFFVALPGFTNRLSFLANARAIHLTLNSISPADRASPIQFGAACDCRSLLTRNVRSHMAKTNPVWGRCIFATKHSQKDKKREIADRHKFFGGILSGRGGHADWQCSETCRSSKNARTTMAPKRESF
jgi:hypothetical protein